MQVLISLACCSQPQWTLRGTIRDWRRECYISGLADLFLVISFCGQNLPPVFILSLFFDMLGFSQTWNFCCVYTPALGPGPVSKVKPLHK